MKTQMSFLPSTARILSLGFFCGLMIVPVSWLLFRSLALRYAQSRGGSNLPPVPSTVLRTERGLIVHVPSSTRDRASVLLTAEQEANKHICVSPTSNGEKLQKPGQKAPHLQTGEEWPFLIRERRRMGSA